MGKKIIIIYMLLLMAIILMADNKPDSLKTLESRLSFYISESIRTPLDEENPFDYEIFLSMTYNDNVDVYFIQERDNGVFQREYSLDLQNRIYKDIYIAGKMFRSPRSDLWSVDLKWLYNENNWKTYIGVSNCWDPKHGVMLLLEETKSYYIDFFLVPTEILFNIKTLSDFNNIYHSEKFVARFYIAMPTAWGMNEYMRASVNLIILSKDYGYYRWQQKIMIGFDYLKKERRK